MHQGNKRNGFRISSLEQWFPWFYIAIIGTAESEISFANLWVGVFLHVALLVTLIVLASLSYEKRERNFYQALMLGPLIRLISMVLPMSNIPVMWRYFAVSLPLFIAAFTVARLNSYRASKIYLKFGRIRPQILIGLVGIPMGLIEYFILRPVALIPSLTVGNLLSGILVMLISTGFLEELIFRSIIQKAALDFMGWGNTLIFVSLAFTSLHIIHLSFPDLLFVWVAGIYFSVAVHKTKSIFGVTVAHGLNNIILYLIAPLLFHLSWGGFHFP